MSSNLRSETARINGAKSRGPVSAEGLAKSSRNALKHGLTSISMIILDTEDPDEFDRLLNDFFARYQPAGPAEQDLVEEMVAARWRIRRMWVVETSLLNSEILAQLAKIVTSDAAPPFFSPFFPSLPPPSPSFPSPPSFPPRTFFFPLPSPFHF